MLAGSLYTCLTNQTCFEAVNPASTDPVESEKRSPERWIPWIPRVYFGMAQPRCGPPIQCFCDTRTMRHCRHLN